MTKLFLVVLAIMVILSLQSGGTEANAFGLTPTPEPVATQPPVFELPGTIPFVRPRAYLPIMFGGGDCKQWIWRCDFR